jgi:hypothetical protein
MKQPICFSSVINDLNRWAISFVKCYIFVLRIKETV